MFIEYNGVSLIGGNCEKSPMNIMLIPPNGKIIDFIFCSFKCIVSNKCATYYGYFNDNDELDIWPYVYD
jgi:hypothetical protein